jgi:hypothetical protein
MSETDSISSSQSIEVKEKSKVWTEEEIELFSILLRKYGTDFHILSAFFPKKTKNQLKVLSSSLRTDTNCTPTWSENAKGLSPTTYEPSASSLKKLKSANRGRKRKRRCKTVDLDPNHSSDL